MFRGKSLLFLKIGIFLLLLFLSNLYLLRPGFWFYQDAGFWPKTNHEASLLLMQQFHIFTNLGYYIGSDQGLLAFSRIIVTAFTSFLFFLFKQNLSQIIFTMSGYILTFVSFYLFSGIFFRENNRRYILSLLYVFNPLIYFMQGYVFYGATIPLFIYSFYEYFFGNKKLRLKYLLLNIFASFIWVSYIRFIQGYLFIVIPYLIYLIILNKQKLSIKNIIIYIISYLLIFIPTIFAFVSQLLEKSNTAFNYGQVFGSFVVKYKMFEAFNIFQSVGAKLYESNWWPIIGLLFFAFLTYLIIRFPSKNRSRFYFLNLLLVLLSITMYALGNIFGDTFYLRIIHFLPFIINEPFWALYLLSVPYVILIGLLTRNRIKFLYIFSFLFISFATFPLLRLSDFQLQKYNIDSVPTPYKTYFITTYTGIPEASFYFMSDCWRAKFMNDANVPSFCPNYGYHYPPIIFNNPRVISGVSYAMSQLLSTNTHLNNLRITHNLKNIFIPNDIVKGKGPGTQTGDKEIAMVKNAHKEFDLNSLLKSNNNPNFTQYYFANKDLYDFFLYSPNEIVKTNNLNILTNDKLDINTSPVIFFNSVSHLPSSIAQNINLDYKLSPLEPFKYYVHVRNIDKAYPFLVQLNQKFNTSWKIEIIDKGLFDEQQCIGNFKTFPITKNSYCQIKSSFIDLKDIKYLNRNPIAENNHFEGNLQGNAWVVYPDKTINSDDMYLVLIYNKQIYYIYSILIACSVFTILSFSCLIQESQRLFKKNQITNK